MGEMQQPEGSAALSVNTDSIFNSELRELQRNHDREKTDEDAEGG
jgi:hypothetical protein